MRKLSFKVSARTAKLIGQENFSNPEGAIIELVKNCYDADAKNCIVVYDILHQSVPEHVGKKDFESFYSKNKTVKASYKFSRGTYNILSDLNESVYSELERYFFSYNSIYIIDNGEGMTDDIIENQWMVIGTGNKEDNYISDDGRVKTGAKGIGRFALDRLGYNTEMWTIPKKDKKTGFNWKMDWTQFENYKKTINDINAELIPVKFNLKNKVLDIFNDNSRITNFLRNKTFSHGTIIKISGLKDNWTETNIASAYKSLEALIPPKELAIPFTVNLFYLQNEKGFGDVDTAYINEFDYKVESKYNSKNLTVSFTITRNELDIGRIKREYSYLFKKSKPPYDLKTLERKRFTYTKSLRELLKWDKLPHKEASLKRLGDFSFSFYFLKTQSSSKEEYPFKEINSSERKNVLERFGGIKIYRDSFRVRPYGDAGNDWLKLGERASQSPAGAGQRIGDWRVRPYQIAGLVTISRVANDTLIDKSDRGALVENESFDILTEVTKGIISEFELDRTKVLNPFYLDNKEREEAKRKEEIRIEAEKLADKIVAERNKVEEKILGHRTKGLFKEKIEEQERKSFKRIITEGLEKL